MSKIGPKANQLLSEIRTLLEETLTEPDAPDAFDAYMSENSKYLSRETGLSEDEALSLLFSIAEAAEDSGDLPPIPTLYSTEEVIQEWIKVANTSGFVLNAVLEARRNDG